MGGDEEPLEIGSRRVSRTAFTLFAGDAPVRVATLKEEYETLCAHGIVSDAMLDAARGFATLARDLGITELQQIATGFARALECLSVETLSGDEEALVLQAIQALEASATRVIDLQEPSAADELVSWLANVCVRGDASGGSAA
jgi:hypothetical protein